MSRQPSNAVVYKTCLQKIATLQTKLDKYRTLDSIKIAWTDSCYMCIKYKNTQKLMELIGVIYNQEELTGIKLSQLEN